MGKFLRWLLSGAKERRYYTVALQGKYTDVGVTVETYVSSHVFETWVEASRFACRLAETSQAYNILGVVEITTDIPLSVTHIDYDITDEAGRHQISYTWPEGVDTKAQQAAEEAKMEATRTTVRESKPKRRPRTKKS